jgi:hypothetical protein
LSLGIFVTRFSIRILNYCWAQNNDLSDLTDECFYA